MSVAGAKTGLADWPWQWGIAALLAVTLRLGLIGYYGILYWPDSAGYIEHAQYIYNAPSLRQFLLGQIELLNFRTIGYPTIIAVAMTLGGSIWPSLVVTLQIALSLLMLWWLYRLCLALGAGKGYAALSAGIFGCCHVAMYDTSILTDAIFTHISVVGLCLLLVPLVEQRRVRLMRALCAGLLIGVSIVVREATLFFVPVLLIAFIVVMNARRMPWPHMGQLLGCFVLPVLVIWQGYATWNDSRVGSRMLTSVGQTVYLLHPLQIEARGRTILRDSRLRLATDSTASHYAYGHAVEINSYLEEHYELDEWQRTYLARDAFWQAWSTDIDAMALEAIYELRWKYATQLAELSKSVRDYPIMAGLSERANWSSRSAASKVFELALRIFSVVVFVSCVVGVPVLIICGPARDLVAARLAALAFCWLVFAGMVAMYAFIHMEFRYSLLGQAFAIVAGMVVLRHLTLLWRNRGTA